ncbi:hypothetical protein Q8A67_024602 [Cirrhinus molitorella]|uniref:Immunoglobulin V-set domain-containing protein n=1 Tax=Cirrhinus molitorella TaxID=172907 RepID=A0AA88P288_9TELE|nr:hypothetical protein Q8A67_024602 [Cirrhinus molitorella]
MRSSGILWILLLVPLSTANRGLKKCKGENTTLSCLDPANHIEGKVEINAVWKKDSGERVIWKYYSDSKKGDAFRNRAIVLNDDLSLTIDGCDQSDQGTYILCIDGRESCQVRLFVSDSKQCKQKTTGQPTTSPTSPMAKEAATDGKHLQTETPNIYIRYAVYALPCSVVLVVLLLVVRSCILKKETNENDKSESKLLHLYI